MKNVILFIIIIVTLSGCSTISSFKVLDIGREKLNLESPEPVTALPVKFVVITKENQAEVFKEMEKSKKEPVLFALDATNYKNLSLNFRDIINYISIQNKVLDAYKKYYEEE